MEQKKTLIVIVPAYNEEETIAETLASLRKISAPLAEIGFDLKLYVVNDGSEDATLEAAQNAKADRVIVHKVNRGLGAAVRSGLTAARHDGADIAIKFDADLQHEPDDILKLIEPILNDESDVVYGYRFSNIKYRMPLVRKVGNKVFTGLMRWLTDWDIRDAQPGIFAVHSTYLDVFRLPGDYNYTQQILLDSYHKGMRFSHIPVTFNKRTTGSSFITFKYPLRVLWQIVMVLIGVKPMRIFGTIGVLFLLVAVGIASVQLSQFFMGQADRPIENANLVLGTGLFGLQTVFFGALAQLIIERR